MEVKEAQSVRSAKTKADSASVLVVEASDGDWRHHQDQLAAAGIVTETVRFGAQAAQRLKDGDFDLIVLDGSAAASEARNLLTGIRKSHPMTDLPVIMVAPSAESFDIVRVFESGANDCVAPPVDVPVLAARIRAQLAIRGSVGSVAQPDPAVGSVDWLQMIMDNVTIAIFETGADGSITRMNTAASHLTGRDPDDLVGQPLGSIFMDESGREISSLLARAATDGYFVNNHPVHMRDETGRERVFGLSLRQIGDDRHAAGVVATAEDVTETWNRREWTPAAGETVPLPPDPEPAAPASNDAEIEQPADAAPAGESSSGEENRTAVRRRVFKGAKLSFNYDSSLMDCVVRDISESGAKLVFESYFDCPREVRLRISDGRAYECEVRWFLNKTMGVSFLAPIDGSEPPSG